MDHSAAQSAQPSEEAHHATPRSDAGGPTAAQPLIRELLFSKEELRAAFSSAVVTDLGRAHEMLHLWPDLKMTLDDVIRQVEDNIPKIKEHPPSWIGRHGEPLEHALPEDKKIASLLLSDSLNACLRDLVRTAQGEWVLFQIEAYVRYARPVRAEDLKNYLADLKIPEEIRGKFAERFARAGACFQEAVDGLIVRAHLSSRTRSLIAALGGAFDTHVIKQCSARLSRVSQLFKATGSGESLELCGEVGDVALVEALHKRVGTSLGSLCAGERTVRTSSEIYARAQSALPALALLGDYPYAQLERLLSQSENADSLAAALKADVPLLSAVVDSLVLTRDFKNVAVLREKLGIDVLPASPQVVAEFLSSIVENEHLGECEKENSVSADLNRFISATGIVPDFSTDRKASIRERYLFSQADGQPLRFRQLERYLDIPSIDDDKQRQLYSFCACVPNSSLGTTETGWQPPADASEIQAIVDHQLRRVGTTLAPGAFIDCVERLTRGAGIKVVLAEDTFSSALERLSGERRSEAFNSYSVYLFDAVGFLCWSEVYTGSRAPTSCIEALRERTHGNNFRVGAMDESEVWTAIAEHYDGDGVDVAQQYGLRDLPVIQDPDDRSSRYIMGVPGPFVHAWIAERYGPMSPESAQRIYWRALSKDFRRIDGFVETVDQIVAETAAAPGGPYLPDRASMLELAQVADPEVPAEVTLRKHFDKISHNSLTCYHLTTGEQLGQLENMLGMRIEVDPREAQLLLLEAIPDMFHFGCGDSDEDRAGIEAKRSKSWDDVESLVNFISDRSGVGAFPDLAAHRYSALAREKLVGVGEFSRLQQLLGIPPTADCIKRAYLDIANVCFGEHPDTPLSRIDVLREALSHPPEMTIADTEAIFDACSRAPWDHHHKMQILIDKLQLPLTEEIVQRKVLDDKRFHGRFSYPISAELLDRHFSDQKNNNIVEYIRIYRIFGCYDYYMAGLAKLEAASGHAPRTKRVALLCGIAYSEQDQARYVAAREGILAINAEKDPRLIRMVSAAFVHLINGGEHYMPREFGKTVRRYCAKKPDEGKKACRLGYDELVAFRVLGGTSYWEGNKALLSTVFTPRVDTKLRRLVLRHLAGPSGNLPEYTAKVVREVLDGDADSIGGRPLGMALDELDFYRAIRNMPSISLSTQSAGIFDNALRTLHKRGLAAHALHAAHGSAIPKGAFVQVGNLVDWDPALLAKFDGVYRALPSSIQRNNLLVGIVLSCQAGESRIAELRALLRKDPLDSPEAPANLTQLLRYVGFMQRTDHRAKRFRLPSVQTDFLTSGASVAEALGIFRADERRIIVELSHNEISPYAVPAMQNLWKGTDAIIGVMTGLEGSHNFGGSTAFKEVLTQGVSSGTQGWKEYRYREDRPVVRAQLAHLTAAQNEVWEANHLEEVANLESPATLGDPAQAIADMVCAGALQVESGKFTDIASFQQAVRDSQESGSADSKKAHLQSLAAQAKVDLEKVAVLLKAEQLRRIFSTLDSPSHPTEVLVNTRTKQLLQALSVFVETETGEASPLETYRALASSGGRVSWRALLPAETEARLRELGRQLEAKAAEVLGDQSWLERQGLTSEPTGQSLHRRAQSLAAVRDLCMLSTLSNDLVPKFTRNGFSHSLQRFQSLASGFQGTLLGDALKESIKILKPSGARRAMLFTDDPFILLNIGKYPLGAASCVNYESSPDRVAMLPSYMGDSHIKALVLIDIDKLSPALRQEIDEKGFEAAKSKLTHFDLLEASIFRRILRCVKAERFGAGIYMEPVYPRVPLDRPAVDDQFIGFLSERVAGPMGIPTLEEGEDLEVTVPAGRYETGQLEDRIVGNGRIYPMAVMKGAYTMRAQVAGSFRPAPLMDAVPEPVATVGADVAEQHFDTSLLAPVLVDPETNARGFRVNSWFDLKTAVFFSGDSPKRIREVQSAADWHITQVRQPSFRQVIELSREGFFFVPDRVQYRLAIPAPSAPDDLLSGYFSEFGHGGQRRRDINKLAARISSGELNFIVSRGDVPGQGESFVELYLREMGGKARGWAPLVNRIREEGRGVDGFLANDRIGLFIQHQGQTIAGLIAKRLSDHYSISYAASDSDARRQFRQLSLFLVLDLMKRSMEERLQHLNYGSDANLYGHHLSVGLAGAKIGQGFKPVPSGNRVSLVRFCDLSPFDQPVFFYAFGPRNVLQGVQIGDTDQALPQELLRADLGIKSFRFKRDGLEQIGSE